MKWTENKSLRYGGLSVGLTVAVIAVIVVINVIVSSVFSLVGAHLDMTSDDLFEISEETHSLLGKVNAEENDVTLYFLTDPDNLGQVATSNHGYTSTGLWGMKYIHELALELAEKYDYISVDYINLTKEPERVKEIVGEDYDKYALSSAYIIVDNYTPERDSKGNILTDSNGQPTYWHNYRICSRDNFYNFNTATYGVIGFQGDYRFCSSILSVTKAVAPTAYILTGHGETVGTYTMGEESTDFGDAYNLWNMLFDCGYNIRHINLQYEQFDEDEEDALAIIYSPKSDYLSGAAGSVSEIEKLESFLAVPGHSLMVFADPDRRELPNLEGFLEQVGGVTLDSDKLKNDGSASITVDGYSLAGSFVAEGNPLSEALAPLAADSKAIFRLSRTIRISDPAKAKAVYVLPEGCVAEANDGSVTEAGDGALLTLSEVNEGSYILTCGTSMLSYVSYTQNPGYLNRSILTTAIGILTGDDTAGAVRSRVIPNEGLDLTTQEATVWTVITTAALPLVFAVIGICVYIRRRHS